jgi:putative transposase
MKDYRRGAHTTFEIHLHLVWVTKYRKPVMTGEVGTRLRELIREICGNHEVTIIKGHISKDHVHLFVSILPQVTISRLLQMLKGEDLVQADERVSTPAQEVLGAAHVGARVLLRQFGQRH